MFRQTSPQLRCPYCAHVAASSEMHTEEAVAYLKRLVHREVVIPLLNQFTSGLEDMFPGGGHSGGLSISLKTACFATTASSTMAAWAQHWLEPSILGVARLAFRQLDNTGSWTRFLLVVASAGRWRPSTFVGPVVGRPVRHAIFRLVCGMDLRLHPCVSAACESLDFVQCRQRLDQSQGQAPCAVHFPVTFHLVEQFVELLVTVAF